MVRKILLLLFFLLIPGTVAHALPTPDVFISLVNIVPLITGGIVTVVGGAYYSLRKYVGPFGSKILLVSLLCGLVLSVGVAFLWNQGRQQQRIDNIAVYLRCDQIMHNYSMELFKVKDPKLIDKWRDFGNFKKIAFKDIPENLRNRPSATFVAASSRTIMYHSGFPAVKADEKLVPFSLIRAPELSKTLAKDTSKDLYLTDFRYIILPPSYYTWDKTFFEKYENIYIVKGVSKKDRYIQNLDGQLVQANFKNKVIKWPVEQETWIYDEKRINFPNISNLLPDREVAKLLFEEDVYLLAPYSNYRRRGDVYRDTYLKRLTYNVDPSRVIAIDMNVSTTTARLKHIAAKLDGARFIVVGLTKPDWIYDGLDAAFDIWEHLGHDPDRFKLLGFTTRLPEAVAISWEADTRKGSVDALRKPFWSLVTWLNNNLGLSGGAAIFLVAILLRLLFSPIGFCEASSRLKRARVKKMASAQDRPLWFASSQALLTHLKVKTGWEFLGTLVMLLLILPAYNILSVPPESFKSMGFLWIKDIAKPDLVLAIFVGILILSKMQMNLSRKKLPITVLATIGFVIMLTYLPGSLLVYVSGVLIITVLQDAMAIFHTRTALSRALLKKV